MKKEDIPYLRLVDDTTPAIDALVEQKKPRQRLKKINSFLDRKGLEWSTILIVCGAFTVLILFISLGIISLISV